MMGFCLQLRWLPLKRLTQYRGFLDTNNLASLSHAPDIQRPWTHCQACGKDQFENIIYSFDRIDDILLPANLAAQCHPCQICEQGLSDHLPLLAHIPTYILNARIPRIAQSQPMHNFNHQVNLVRPIRLQIKMISSWLSLTQAMVYTSNWKIQSRSSNLLMRKHLPF